MDQERTKSQKEDNTTGIVQIKCGLFPSMPIFVSLHKKDSSTSSDPTMNSPHLIAQRLSKIQHVNGNTACDLLLSSYNSLEEENNNHHHKDNNSSSSNNDVDNHLGGLLVGNYFALADASRIFSLDHLSVAIHTALLRTYRHSLHDTDHLNRHRGKALESIVCAAGSTHVASILKDYAFLLPTPPQSNHQDNKEDVAHHDGTHNHVWLLIGVNVSLDVFRQVLLDKNIGLESVPPEPSENMTKYFSRERTSEEITALIKSYKITREEVAMQGLERAIIHRVASKFYTS